MDPDAYGVHDPLFYGFLNNYHVLVRRLSTDSILPNVLSSALITEEQKECIEKKDADGQKTQLLLDIILRLGNTNREVCEKFFELLSDDSITGGQNLTGVIEEIKKDSLSAEVAKKFAYSCIPLNEKDRDALMKHKGTIVKSLFVEDVLPQLMAFGAVTLDEKEKVESEATHSEKAKKLVSVIEERGSAAYCHFVSVLCKSDRYKHFGELLKGQDNTTTDATPRTARSELTAAEVSKYIKRLDTPRLYELGGHLGLDLAVLRKIDSLDLPLKMSELWLEEEHDVSEVSGTPSWEGLVKALIAVGSKGVAKKIKTDKNIK